jgi:hypothetical protein
VRLQLASCSARRVVVKNDFVRCKFSRGASLPTENLNIILTDSLSKNNLAIFPA